MTPPKIDICYIVSHGFAARMILQTGMLARLAKEGLKIGLITPDKEDANLVSFCEENNIQLFEYNLTNKLWSEDYWVRRRYILEDIEANPALWEKHLKAINFKSNKSKHPWRHIRPRIYRILNKYARSNPKFVERFKQKESEYLKDKKAIRFLQEEVNPGILVSTYPVNLQEAILLNAANHIDGIQTVMHLLSWDNISSKGHFPAMADKYIAWGPIMADEFQSYYDIPKKDIHVCGVPHFDEHYHAKHNPDLKYVERLGLNPAKPYLFFAMSSPYFAPNEIDIVEWLAEKVNTDVFGKDMQLIVRPHPQNVQGHMADQSWLPRLEKIKRDKVAVDYPQLVKSNLKWSMKKEDMIRFSQLLAGSTLCLNSGSTVAIDTLMVDRPVILTSFDANQQVPYWDSACRLIDYVHLKKLIARNGISVTKNFEELSYEIHAYIKDNNRKLKERTETKTAQTGYDDGKATSRVVDLLLSFTKSKIHSI